eukprot:637095-Pleurochrysis_carterae.AAC.1
MSGSSEQKEDHVATASGVGRSDVDARAALFGRSAALADADAFLARASRSRTLSLLAEEGVFGGAWPSILATARIASVQAARCASSRASSWIVVLGVRIDQQRSRQRPEKKSVAVWADWSESPSETVSKSESGVDCTARRASAALGEEEEGGARQARAGPTSGAFGSTQKKRLWPLEKDGAALEERALRRVLLRDWVGAPGGQLWWRADEVALGNGEDRGEARGGDVVVVGVPAVVPTVVLVARRQLSQRGVDMA